MFKSGESGESGERGEGGESGENSELRAGLDLFFNRGSVVFLVRRECA
jgi:hypothetical protein